MRLSRLEAETASAAKSLFLANMSHELRTPLNGVIAMAELLRARQDDPAQQRMAATIVTSGRALEKVVGDILDISKIKSGRITIRNQPFDLIALVADVVDLHRPAAAAKGVTIDVDIRADAEGMYEGDRERVFQILSNLICNAVKFTQRGVVRVRVRGEAAGFRLIVADTGVGFDRAIAHRLFRSFERADNSLSRNCGGAGLGLSICDALVRMMDGRIAVRSQLGRGTVFNAHLPLQRLAGAAAAQTPASGVEAPEHASWARILVADDHEVNRRVVALVLEPLDVEVVEVENGVRALEAVKTSAFDLILMDVQMPIMDGLTATRAIRALEAERRRPRTPIISVTAHTHAEDIARSLQAGSDMHLGKPIHPAALIAAVQSVLARAGDRSVLGGDLHVRNA